MKTTWLACSMMLVAAVKSEAADDYDEAPHFYSTAPANDPVATLAQQVRDGHVPLAEETDRELAASLLVKLHIPVASQVLVFSKTSLQRDKITPANPRAIYFNDDTYLAWVPGGMMEFTGIHPQLGAYFYGLDPESSARPRQIVRHQNCLDCHAGGMTGHWPGLMVRSVFADERGFPLLQAGTTVVDHSTPIEKRWGGWYVTGQHGDLRHLGNSIAKEKGDTVTLDREAGANKMDLRGMGIVGEKEYLGQGSDILALMLLEHQITLQTKMTAAAYEVRSILALTKSLRKELGEPETTELTGSAKSVTANHAEKLLKALLFSDEAPLPKGGIEGGMAFQDAFLENRRKAKSGRSLKDLQLLNRLFKFRCSYQIYSRQWLGLPEPLKTLVYTNLNAVLSAEKPPAAYASMAAPERAEILEILLETHPEFAAAVGGSGK